MAAANDVFQRCLVATVLVHQRKQREQHHLDLLRRRQPGRVVQRHCAAVSDQTVDELQLRDVGDDRCVSPLQKRFGLLGQLRQRGIEDTVPVKSHGAQPPTRRAKILRVGVNQDRVPWAHGEQGPKIIGKGTVDVVGQDDQIGPIVLHDIGDLGQAAFVELHRGRIARIDAEEHLDRGILQLLQFGVRILPAGLRIGVDRHFRQPVDVEFRDLDIGREDRHADRHLVPFLDELVLFQRIEDVGHRRGSRPRRRTRPHPQPKRARQPSPSSDNDGRPAR